MDPSISKVSCLYLKIMPIILSGIRSDEVFNYIIVYNSDQRLLINPKHMVYLITEI